jgi:opacity protein-like surface antigen
MKQRIWLIAALLAIPTMTSANPADHRPADGFSVGLGFGVSIDNGGASDLLQPDTASARFRLGRAFTIEPFVDLSVDSTKTDNGVNDDTTTDTDVTFGALARILAIARGPVDFVILGTGGLGYSKTKFEPAAGTDRTDATTTIGFGWGIGLEWWFKKNWVLSFTTTNPALSYSKSTSEVAGVKTSNRTTSVGAIFDPDVNVMVHMFF